MTGLLEDRGEFVGNWGDPHQLGHRVLLGD
jgi:hypothetical protein